MKDKSIQITWRINVLQAIRCEKCDKSYLVGINGKDIRKAPVTNGKLGNDSWIGIDHKDTKDVPWIKEGDKIPCPTCGVECIVEELKPIKRDIDDPVSVNESTSNVD